MALQGPPGTSWGILGPPRASCGLPWPLGASWGLLEPPGASWVLLGPPGNPNLARKEFYQGPFGKILWGPKNFTKGPLVFYLSLCFCKHLHISTAKRPPNDTHDSHSSDPKVPYQATRFSQNPVSNRAAGEPKVFYQGARYFTKAPRYPTKAPKYVTRTPCWAPPGAGLPTSCTILVSWLPTVALIGPSSGLAGLTHVALWLSGFFLRHSGDPPGNTLQSAETPYAS